jgi:hypothetical protein
MSDLRYDNGQGEHPLRLISTLYLTLTTAIIAAIEEHAICASGYPPRIAFRLIDRIRTWRKDGQRKSCGQYGNLHYPTYLASFALQPIDLYHNRQPTRTHHSQTAQETEEWMWHSYEADLDVIEPSVPVSAFAFAYSWYGSNND